MKIRTVSTIFLILTLLGCALPPAAGSKSDSCKSIVEAGLNTYSSAAVPTVAKGFYREHLWYNVYTRPGIYFNSTVNDKNAVRVLAVGDSWFAYPKNLLFLDFLFGDRSNLLTNLASPDGSPHLLILSLSNSGELISNMAGIAMKNKDECENSVQNKVSIPGAIVSAMIKAQEINAPFEYIILSGGGNDLLIENRIKRILKLVDCRKDDSYDKCFDINVLKEYIDRVGIAYLKLIELITSNSKFNGVKIITHTYDNFIPMPKGASFLAGLIQKGHEGWLYPELKNHKMDDGRGQDFAKRVVCELRNKLLEIERTHSSNFLVVDTVGTFSKAAETESTNISKVYESKFWLNEIHPTSEGFKLISNKIDQAIRTDREGGARQENSRRKC